MKQVSWLQPVLCDVFETGLTMKSSRSMWPASRAAVAEPALLAVRVCSEPLPFLRAVAPKGPCLSPRCLLFLGIARRSIICEQACGTNCDEADQVTMLSFLQIGLYPTLASASCELAIVVGNCLSRFS